MDSPVWKTSARSRSWRLHLLGLAVLALGVLGASPPARGAPVTLQNDGYISGGSVGVQSGFVTGEMGAVTLGPVSDPFQINEIQLIFGPAQPAPNDPVTVTLRIYQELGGAEPGAEVFNFDYSLTPASDAMTSIDVSGDNIVLSAGASFRVAIEFQHDGEPSIARDDDGVTSGRNWIYTSGFGWVDSGDLGVLGDWIIRAVVETQPVTEPDGGVLDGGGLDGGGLDGAAQPDAATADAAAGYCTVHTDCQGGEMCVGNVCRTVCANNDDCGPGEICNGTVCVVDPDPPADDSGCGCRAADTGGSAPLVILLLLLALGLTRRRLVAARTHRATGGPGSGHGSRGPRLR